MHLVNQYEPSFVVEGILIFEFRDLQLEFNMLNMGIVMETFWHAITKIYCLRKRTFLLLDNGLTLTDSYKDLLFKIILISGFYASSSIFFLLHLFQIFLISGNSLFQNNNNNNLYYILKKLTLSTKVDVKSH